MFKVGDKVVLDNSDQSIYEINHYSHLGNGYIMKCGKTAAYSLVKREATKEEIAAGHRIDKCKCVVTRTYENGMCNKCGLRYMGDDSHIENHVSKNCKVIDYEID